MQFVLLIFLIVSPISSMASVSLKWVAIKAPTKEARTKLANLGVSMENIVDDTVYVIVQEEILRKIKRAKFEIKSSLNVSEFSKLGFPNRDSDYHDYYELIEALSTLKQKRPNLVQIISLGRTPENRNIWAIRLNSDNIDVDEISGKPGIVFIGGHHSREHLSVEIPLKLAQHLVNNYGTDSLVTRLLDTREVFIIPAMNPDGLEYDISAEAYLFWRKNRRSIDNSRCIGVDLNRNYGGHKWGEAGSSSDPCSDVYHGPKPFSEPEAKAIKTFLEKRINIKILLSFHSYSELILYPWGYKYDPIENKKDLDTHKTMAQTMSRWNNYRPMQSSSLYVTAGDTTDWSYATLGIISFTFELSPGRGFLGSGFYPGNEVIEHTSNNNLRPALYLIDLADDPYRAVRNPETTLFYNR